MLTHQFGVQCLRSMLQELYPNQFFELKGNEPGKISTVTQEYLKGGVTVSMPTLPPSKDVGWMCAFQQKGIDELGEKACKEKGREETVEMYRRHRVCDEKNLPLLLKSGFMEGGELLDIRRGNLEHLRDLLFSFHHYITQLHPDTSPTGPHLLGARPGSSTSYFIQIPVF